MKYKFERIKKGAVNVDKLSFEDTNEALDKARDWMKADKDLEKVKIEIIEPKNPYKIEIERC